jgi:WD40 repeat protein
MWPVATPTPLPPIAISIPTSELPVLAGTPVPRPQGPITPDNAAHVAELAVWGKGEIQVVGYSPNGRFLVVGTTAGIWLYDAQTLNQVRFIDTGRGVGSMAFSSDSSILYADLGASTLAAWNMMTGELVTSRRVREGYQGDRRILPGVSTFSKDAAQLAATLDNRQVGVWNASGERINILRLDGYPSLMSLSFSPSGTLLAMDGYSQVELWDIQKGALASVLAQDVPAHNLSFSPDGTALALAGSDQLWLWDVKEDASLWTQRWDISSTARIAELAFSLDGALLAAGQADGTVWLLNKKDGKRLHHLQGSTCKSFPFSTCPVTSLAFSPDSTVLAAGAKDGTVRLWNAKTGSSLGVLKGFAAHVGYSNFDQVTLVVASDGTIFTAMSTSLDTGIQAWDARTGQIVRTLPGPEYGIASLSLSGSAKTLAAGVVSGTSVWVWDIETGQPPRKVDTLFGEHNPSSIAQWQDVSPQS